MRATERRIYHFDMEVKRRGHTTHLPPLNDLLAVWKERSDASTAFQVRSSGDLRFNIEQVDFYDDNIACLLVSVSDRNSPDAVYQDFTTQETTVYPKEATQGGMVSSHIVVSTLPSKVDTYFCAIEQASKLNSTNIELLLNRILHDEYDANESRFSYANVAGRKDRAGNIQRHNFLPRVELKGHLSNELIESLENGRLSSIVLVNDEEKADFGDNPFLVESERHLIIKAKADLPRGGRLNSIVDAVRRRSEGYEKARIRFTAPDGRPQSIEFNASDGSIIDSRFVKNELLGGIAPPLADASSTIVIRLLRPMMTIVRGVREGA